MNDRAAIDAVIKDYLDGLYEGDTEKLGRAFHPTSALTHVNEGKLVIVPRDDWFKAVNSRPKPKDSGMTRHDEVLSVDILDDCTALVKLKCALPPKFFTDLLSLLKVDGRWQIVQKVFTFEVK